MNNHNDQSKSYLQSVILRGALHRYALAWPGSLNLVAVRVPLLDPDALAIIGIGSYFEPFFTNEALCMCFHEHAPDEKEKDLKPLVEYLRSMGG